VFNITDTEYVLAVQRNDAEDALGGANRQIRIANAEISRLRRELVVANNKIAALETEKRSLAERLISVMRRH
jgi:hypothetical protein